MCEGVCLSVCLSVCVCLASARYGQRLRQVRRGGAQRPHQIHRRAVRPAPARPPRGHLAGERSVALRPRPPVCLSLCLLLCLSVCLSVYVCVDKDMDPPMAKSDEERLELFRKVGRSYHIPTLPYPTLPFDRSLRYRSRRSSSSRSCGRRRSRGSLASSATDWQNRRDSHSPHHSPSCLVLSFPVLSLPPLSYRILRCPNLSRCVSLQERILYGGRFRSSSDEEFSSAPGTEYLHVYPTTPSIPIHSIRCRGRRGGRSEQHPGVRGSLDTQIVYH